MTNSKFLISPAMEVDDGMDGAMFPLTQSRRLFSINFKEF